MLLSKHRNLIRCLPQDGSLVTAKELAARLDVSVRSVKSYISEISAELPHFIESTRKGYRANFDFFSEKELYSENSYPDTQQKRILYMIRRLLENRPHTLSIVDFEAEMLVGDATIRKDLPAMRRKLKEFDLFLNHKEGILSINGDESNKRRMLAEIVYLEFNDNILSLETIGQAFPTYDVPALKELLTQVCSEQHYFINEYALISLVLDLLISIDRVKNNHFTAPIKRTYQLGAREQDLALCILRKIEQLYSVSFNQFEVDELTVLLFAHLSKVDYRALTLDKVQGSVSKQTLRIVELIQKELEELDFLDFENQELMLCFTIHINNLLKRLENSYVTINPLTDQIKNGCTFIYELSVLIASIINRETGHYVDKHETAYIAIHIGSMLQIQQSLRNKARCILLFPQYYNYANRLMEQLTHRFGSSLVFLGVLTSAEELSQYPEVDMILTTVDIAPENAVEIVHINPFISEREQIAIQNTLERVVRKKKLVRLRKSLLDISSQELFFVSPNLSNADEAISFMSHKMIEQGYASDPFYDAVVERERTYSTAYGDIAVPHALQFNAQKTGMCVCFSEKGVLWGQNKVKIILLFSVNRDDKGKFYEVFENLIVLLLEPGNVAMVAASKTYEEFVENILQCV